MEDKKIKQKTVKKTDVKTKKTYQPKPKRIGSFVLRKANGDMIVSFDGKNNEYIKANIAPKGDYTAGDEVKI